MVRPELAQIYKMNGLTPQWGQPVHPDLKENNKRYPTAEELRDWIPVGKCHAQPIRIITNDMMGITQATFNDLIMKLRDNGELICVVENGGAMEIFRAESYDEFLEWKQQNIEYQAQKAKERKDKKDVYG